LDQRFEGFKRAIRGSSATAAPSIDSGQRCNDIKPLRCGFVLGAWRERMCEFLLPSSRAIFERD
jgi:hypothetical protein